MRRALLLAALGLVCVTAAPAEVRIWGYVYCWHPEIIPPQRPWYDTRPEFEIPGQGTYVPLQGLLVQVEFGGITPDPTGYTGTNGMYAAKYRNPLDGYFDVDLEIRDELLLGTYDVTAARTMPMTLTSQPQVDGVCTVGCRPEKNSVWVYNGQTGNTRVLINTECRIDAWIGGPKNNLTFWAYGDTGGRKTLAGLHQCLAVRRAYEWLTSRGIPAHNLWRDTNLAYPQDDTSHYQPLALPPGIGNIYIDARRLYTDQFATSEDRIPERIVRGWDLMACTVMHEYSHKIMHDVYWALPQSFKVWQGSDHTTTTCKNAELAWKEGWAEFLPAAINNRPTVNGRPVHNIMSDEENLELSWAPPEAPYLDETTTPGNLDWRAELADDKRAINELENAAVLWDIYDPTGPEFFPQAEQDKAQAAAWPSRVTFFDRLEDPNLARLWPLLRDHNPDCLLDEGDVLEDSLWYYWLDAYSAHDFLVHGLKAILYNRGISTQRRPQHAPTVQMAVSADRQTATLTVTEPDAEDRPFLSYNLACGGSSYASRRVLYDRDKPLVCDNWVQGRATTTIPLPTPGSYDTLILLVHDDMNCTFVTQTEGGYDGRRVDWKGFVQVEKGGRETEWHIVEPGMKESQGDFQFDAKRQVINDWFPGGAIFLIPGRNEEFNDTVYKCKRWSVKPLFGTALTHHPDLYTAPLLLRSVPADLTHLILGFTSQATAGTYPNGEVFRRSATIRLLDKNRNPLCTVTENWQDRGGKHRAVIYFPLGQVKLGDPSTRP